MDSLDLSEVRIRGKGLALLLGPLRWSAGFGLSDTLETGGLAWAVPSPMCKKCLK